MSHNQTKLLKDIIARVMDTLNTRRKNMCEFFEDFDGEFMDDGFDDCDFDEGADDYSGGTDEYELEDSVNDELASDNDSNQEDDRCDEFDPFFVGGLIGFAYEEGRR